jgi:hypothetical protein
VLDRLVGVGSEARRDCGSDKDFRTVVAITSG